jgi:hypothetical protein
LIRRTLHGRRFADYAVARYTLTAVGPAVTGRAGGGEGESAVNRLGAIREEGLIIELDGRLHGPAVWTMGSDKGGLRIRPIQKTESPPLSAHGQRACVRPVSDLRKNSRARWAYLEKMDTNLGGFTFV